MSSTVYRKVEIDGQIFDISIQYESNPKCL